MPHLRQHDQFMSKEGLIVVHIPGQMMRVELLCLRQSIKCTAYTELVDRGCHVELDSPILVSLVRILAILQKRRLMFTIQLRGACDF